MDFGIYAGDTDKTIYLRLRDSTTGLAKTGLAYNSAGAVCSYTLPLAARAAITLATQTVTGAHSDGGFVEVDATNCKGLYRLDLPDAAIASGAFTVISIEFDGIIEESVEILLAVKKANTTQFAGTAITSAAGIPEVKVASIAAGAVTNATFNADVGSTAIATNVIGIAAKKGVVDALNVDTYAEPGQEAPAATNTLVKKIGYLFKNWRNRKTQTSTTWSLYADDATTVDQKATVADDATTASKTEVATGP